MAQLRVLGVEAKDDEASDDADDDACDDLRKKQLVLVHCNQSRRHQLLFLQLHRNHCCLWSFGALEETEGNVSEDADCFRDHKLIDTCYQSLLVMI